MLTAFLMKSMGGKAGFCDRLGCAHNTPLTFVPNTLRLCFLVFYISILRKKGSGLHDHLFHAYEFTGGYHQNARIPSGKQQLMITGHSLEVQAKPN